MTKIAVLAKSSDFENASYLDLRNVFEKLDWGLTFFEISDLPSVRLAISQAKLVIFTTGVLANTELRDYLEGPLKPEILAFLNKGNSFLILSQLLMSQEQIPIRFLPRNLEVSPVTRPTTENRSGGKFSASSKRPQQSLLFPKFVDLDSLEKTALESELGGLYFHHWKTELPENWTPIIVDAHQPDRCLVLEHVDPNSSGRVILSALPLERLGATDLLGNLIDSCMAGTRHCAYLVANKESLTKDEVQVMAGLYAAGVEPAVYELSQLKTESTFLAIRSGVHGTVLVSASVDLAIFEKLSTELTEETRSGLLLLIRLSLSSYSSRFEFKGRESSEREQLARSRLRIDVEKGLYGHSLFDTVRMLMAARSSQGPETIDAPAPQLVAELMSRVGSDGVFEGSIVAVSAFLTLASLIKDPLDAKDLSGTVKKTYGWLDNQIHRASESDFLRSAWLLQNTGSLSKIWNTQLVTMLDKSDPLRFSGFDLLNAARLSLGIRSSKLEPILVKLLFSTADEVWDAGAVRADLLTFLLEARESKALSSEIEIAVDEAISKNVVKISRLDIEGLLEKNFPVGFRFAMAIEKFHTSGNAGVTSLAKLVSSRGIYSTGLAKVEDALNFASKTSKSEKAMFRDFLEEQSKRKLAVFELAFSRLAIGILAVVTFMALVFLYFADRQRSIDGARVWRDIWQSWPVIAAFLGTVTSLVTWTLRALLVKKGT